MSRHLDATMGNKDRLRKKITDGLFGTDGVSSCVDVIAFDEAAEKFRHGTLQQAAPETQQYIERRILALLRLNVSAGKSGWTNNNAESMNHVLKQMVQWRPQKLPELIANLRTLVEAQYTEADRALCGRGDFVLATSHAKHRLTVDAWQDMSAKQKTKVINACFRTQTLPACTSTNGTLTVPTTPGAGKKPHQRKRQRAERSKTVSKTTTQPPLPSLSDDDFA